MLRHLKRALTSPAVIVVVAFLFRMIMLYHFHSLIPAPRLGFQQFGYETGRVARAIAAGEGFRSPLAAETGPTAWFTPVYPYLLAGIFKLCGIYSLRSWLVIQTLNCAFSAFTCVVIFSIGRKVFGDTVAAWSAWAWAFLPAAVMFPIKWVWDTSLSALLLALIFWATLCLPESRRVRDWVAYGALWTLGALTNPSLVSLLPFLLGWAGFKASRQGAAGARFAGAAALIFVLGVSPWFVRNYLVFGQLILFRSNFALEFYLGNNEQVLASSWAPQLHPNDNPEEGEQFRRLGELAYMAEKRHAALQFIATHPGDTARFIFHRFINNWTGAWDPIADVWPSAPAWFRAQYLLNCLFSLLALAGLLLAIRARNADAPPFAMVLLAFPLVYYLTHTDPRYRHPIDPVMIVLAVNALAYPLTRLADRLWAPPIAGLTGRTSPERVSQAR